MGKMGQTEGRVISRELRVMALVSALWVVFLCLIPAFVMGILKHEVVWLLAVSWGGAILLTGGYVCFLSFSFVRVRKIILLLLSGVFLIVLCQVYRIVRSFGLYSIPAVREWSYLLRPLDDLLYGLGVTLFALAFVYTIVELLASREQVIADHTKLSEAYKRLEQTENALRDREAFLQGISTSALDAIIVTDNEGLVAFWNPAAERILGYRSAEVTGKNLHDLLASVSLGKTRGGGDGPWLPDSRGLPVDKTTEVKVKTRNGTEIDAELSISSMEISGQWHAVVILRDITPRKRAEQQYKAVVQSAMDGFWIANHQGQILDVNEMYCCMSGYTREELLGRHISDLEASESPEKVAARIQKIREMGTVRFESGHRRKDGTIIDVEVSVNTNFPGMDDCSSVFIRDLTRQKRYEQERNLLESQFRYAQKLESLGVLAGGIAHDFNNILQIILGNVDLMRKLSQEIPLSQPYVDNIKRSVDRAALMTHQMLTYSGQGDFSPAPLDARAILKEVLPLIRSSISGSVTLEGNLSENLPPIWADATQVRQVAMNLVRNAAEAINGECGGAVTVSLTLLHCDKVYLQESQAFYEAPEGDYVCLEVADTGCGMSEETRRRLLEPFFTTKFTGRGLGMSAVLGIMRAHKGALMVQSVLGKGTVVRALFPRTPCPAQKVPAATAILPGSPARKSATVLLVDHEREMLDMGVIMIKQAGHTVITATDSRGALNTFDARSGDIDCILLNLSFHHLDGGRTLRELRRRRPDIPVILASGHPEHELEERFADEKISAFLRKPYDVRSLSEKIRFVLSGPGTSKESVPSMS